MRARDGEGRLVPLLAVAALACLALVAPGGAAAATVVNGDFESGGLNGWQVHRSSEAGNWFAYKGTDEPVANQRGRLLPQEPPQGKFAAISDQALPVTLILTQQITLPAGLDHRLSLLAYYDSNAPLALPSPNTLSVDSEKLGAGKNQQFRVDVMRAGAPLESLDPADILATVFQTRAGGPTHMSPTWETANLSPFAGQTVTLRIANAAHEELLTAGVDAVAIDSTAPGVAPPPLGSNQFRLGKVKLNRKNGSATLPVEVPGPGTLSAKDGASAKASASKVRKKKQQPRIKPVTVKAARAGTVRLALKPTPSALATLRQKHKLRVQVAVTFAPAGGSPRTATVPVVLKLQPPHHRR